MSPTRHVIGTIAGAAALTLALAPAASAHHCYKVDWNERAYAHHAQGGTAWLPMSDLGELILGQIAPECAGLGYGDQILNAWMEWSGTEVEPLIHSRTVVAGGAYHKAGKTPKPMNFLDEDDFVFLDGQIGAALEDCLGGP